MINEFEFPNDLSYYDFRLQEAENPARQSMSKFRLIWQYMATLILILIQSVMAYFLYLEYGIIAVLLCPLRTGSIIIATILCYYVNTMPISHLRFVLIFAL